MGYPTDVNDAEWEEIKHFFDRKDPRGIKPTHTKREIVNAIFYITRTGCQWRYMPSDLPPWKTVYTYFRTWNIQGLWDKMLTHINKKAREAQGKKSTPHIRYRRRFEHKNLLCE